MKYWILFLKKNKHKCPLPGKWNTKNVIYKATVISDNCVKTDIESTGHLSKRGGTGTAFHSELVELLYCWGSSVIFNVDFHKYCGSILIM